MNNRIRKYVKATNTVSTVGGFPLITTGLCLGVQSAKCADGTTTQAIFQNPGGITTDGTNLYVADTNNHVIRQVVISTGVVTTLAGSAGTAGTADGAGTVARFSSPSSITFDGTDLYVADTGNNLIRKVVISTGDVTTLAGGGAAGNCGVASATCADGTGTAARFSSPTGITTDNTNLYVSDMANQVIRQIVISSKAVTTIAGAVGTAGYIDANGTAAQFTNPKGITTDGVSLFVLDGSAMIRKIVIGGTYTVSTLAGLSGTTAFADGTGTAANFKLPSEITTDGTNLYVADTWNFRIRKVVITTKVVSTIAGQFKGFMDGNGINARLNLPYGITTDGKNIFVTDAEDIQFIGHIRKIE